MSRTVDYRPLRETDYDHLADLFTEANSFDGFPAQQVGDEFREEFETPTFDLDVHTFAAWSGDVLVGATYAYHVPSSVRQECCYVFGTVRPAFRGHGIGRRLLDDGFQTAERLLVESSSEAPKVIRVDVSQENLAAMRLLERKGLQPVRYFADLNRTLEIFPEPRQSATFQIMSWDDSRSDEILKVKNLAFQDHWGSSPMSNHLWKLKTTGFGARPDLSFLAVDSDNSVIGFLVSHRYENDDAILGGKYAWIDNLGTVAQWRGRGVATQLILAALTAYTNAGLDHAAINVDTDNPTGAHRLYESLGFRAWRQRVMFQRTVK